MAKVIKLSKRTQLPVNRIRDAVKDVFKELESKYTLAGSWEKENVFVINGQGISAILEVESNCLTVTLFLDGFLSSFSPIIEGHIKEALEQKLGNGGPI